METSVATTRDKHLILALATSGAPFPLLLHSESFFSKYEYTNADVYIHTNTHSLIPGINSRKCDTIVEART